MNTRNLIYSTALVFGFSAMGTSFADESTVGSYRMTQQSGEAFRSQMREPTASGKCREDVSSKAAWSGGPELQAYIEAHREFLAR